MKKLINFIFAKDETPIGLSSLGLSKKNLKPTTITNMLKPKNIYNINPYFNNQGVNPNSQINIK